MPTGHEQHQTLPHSLPERTSEGRPGHHRTRGVLRPRNLPMQVAHHVRMGLRRTCFTQGPQDVQIPLPQSGETWQKVDIPAIQHTVHTERREQIPKNTFKTAFLTLFSLNRIQIDYILGHIFPCFSPSIYKHLCVLFRNTLHIGAVITCRNWGDG